MTIFVLTQNKHTISIFEAQLRDLAKHIEAHSKKYNAYKKNVYHMKFSELLVIILCGSPCTFEHRVQTGVSLNLEFSNLVEQSQLARSKRFPLREEFTQNFFILLETAKFYPRKIFVLIYYY